MKEGNIMCRIGDVFETCAGGTPLKSKKDYYEELSLKSKKSEIIMNNELPKINEKKELNII